MGFRRHLTLSAFAEPIREPVALDDQQLSTLAGWVSRHDSAPPANLEPAISREPTVLS